MFEIELVEVTEGAKLGKVKRTAVTITNDDEFNSVMSKLLLMTNANVDGMRVHNETWAQQLKDAMVVNGGDLENATTGDYVMHFLTFGFKVRFNHPLLVKFDKGLSLIHSVSYLKTANSVTVL